MLLPIGVLPAGVLPRTPMAYMVTKVASSRRFGRHSRAVWETGGKLLIHFGEFAFVMKKISIFAAEIYLENPNR
ncbi:MAG: hypothetical protein MJZ97_09130 [Bacteroidales bacterium]|nr:hypothetical protein [Bacteroidales bacterium]